MILKFNLSYLKAKKKEKKKFSFFLFYGISLGLVFLILVSLFLYLSHVEKSLLSQKRALLKELKKYKGVEKALAKLKKQNKEIEEHIKKIVGLQKKRREFYRKYVYIVKNLPDYPIIFTDLKIGSRKSFVEGRTIKLKYIAFYLKNLESNKTVIKEVNLLDVKRISSPQNFLNFKIELRN